MEVRVDDYYISTQDFKYIKVCLDGQNIIHEKCGITKTRRTLVDEGIGLIDKYNRRHGLEWGELG